MHFNVRSLAKNIDKLNECICNLKTKPSVIAITETKVNQNRMSANINIDFVKSLRFFLKNKTLKDNPKYKKHWRQQTLLGNPKVPVELGYTNTRARRRRRLKGIHSRSDTNRIGAEGVSFYYPRLLHCLNQMLAVVLLSQHRVSSSKTVRPRAPCGARCIGKLLEHTRAEVKLCLFFCLFRLKK